MLARYPYLPAGKVAAPIFGAAGFIAGWLLALRAFGGLSPLIAAVLWAAIAAVTGFVVFASQGPQRPASVTQAAVADGVVAGIIASISAAIISTLIAKGAGTGSSALSASDFFAAVAAGLLGGGLAGAALGALVLLTGGQERLTRRLATPHTKSSKPSRSRQRKKRK